MLGVPLRSPHTCWILASWCSCCKRTRETELGWCGTAMPGHLQHGCCSYIGLDSRKVATALAAEPDTSEMVGWTCPVSGRSSSNDSWRMDKLLLLIKDIPVFGMRLTWWRHLPRCLATAHTVPRPRQPCSTNDITVTRKHMRDMNCVGMTSSSNTWTCSGKPPLHPAASCWPFHQYLFTSFSSPRWLVPGPCPPVYILPSATAEWDTNPNGGKLKDSQNRNAS